MIDKIKSEILGEVIPAYSKSVVGSTDMSSLRESTNQLVAHLVKKVFPGENLILRSVDPQDDKQTRLGDFSSKTVFVAEITATVEAFEESVETEVAMTESKLSYIAQEMTNSNEMLVRMQKSGLEGSTEL